MRQTALAWFILGTWTAGLAGCSALPSFPGYTARREQTARRSLDGPLTLARLAENRGQAMEAERLYRSILERDPDNLLIYHRLAILEARKGRFDQADAYFEKALNLETGDPTLLSDAGYSQYLQQRWDRAEALLQQALDLDPRHEAATNNLALVLAEKGDTRGALALFRQTGSEARAYANLGFVFARSAEVAKAKAAYRRALSLDPQMMVAAEALVQLAEFEKPTPVEAASSRLTTPAEPPSTHASPNASNPSSHRLLTQGRSGFQPLTPIRSPAAGCRCYKRRSGFQPLVPRRKAAGCRFHIPVPPGIQDPMGRPHHQAPPRHRPPRSRRIRPDPCLHLPQPPPRPVAPSRFHRRQPAVYR